MRDLFLTILELTIAAGCLVPLVLLLRLALGKAPKFIVCILWGMVALRLLLPVTLESPISLNPGKETFAKLETNVLFPVEPPEESVPDLQENQQQAPPTVSTPGYESSLAPEVSASPEVSRPVETTPVIPQVEEEPVSAPLAVDWVSILAWVWFAGVCAMGAYGMISYLRLRRKVQVCLQVEKRVYLCDGISSPFLLGLFRPCIYLPSSMEECHREQVLAHEKAHLRRGDHIWKLVGFALLAIHWVNPLLWVAYFFLCRDIEIACDEKVVRGMDDAHKASYSHALVACSLQGDSHRKWVAACPVAFGEVSVKARVKGVLSYKKPAFWVLLVAILACVAMAVFFLTDPAKEFVWGGFYMDGGEWYVYTSAMDEPIPVDSGDNAKEKDNRLDNFAELYSRITPDGKYLVYFNFESIWIDDLYYISLENPDREPVRVTGNSKFAYITQEEDCLYYVTENRSLYRYTFSDGKKEKIGTEVYIYSYGYNPDYVLISDGGTNIYIRSNGEVIDLPDDLSVDWSQVVSAHAYEDGSFYFAIEDGTGDFSVYFENDLQDREKGEAILDAIAAENCLSLYYYKDGKMARVADLYNEYYGAEHLALRYKFAQDAPVLAYYAPDENRKIPLSQIEKFFYRHDTEMRLSLWENLWEQIKANCYMHLVQGDQPAHISTDLAHYGNLWISADGAFAYSIVENDAPYSEDMFVYEWMEDGVKTSAMVIGDHYLYGNHLLYIRDGKLYRYGWEKPFDGVYSQHERLVRGQPVAEYTIDYEYQVCPVTNTLYYLKDETLCKVEKSKVTEICHKVTDWEIGLDGSIWLISDGDCMIFMDGELVTVRKNVDGSAPLRMCGLIPM